MIFDRFGNRTNDDGSPLNQPLSGAYPDLSNETLNPTMVSGGQSKNFQTGLTGWQVTNDGNCEFNNGLFRGTLEANGVIIVDSNGLSSLNNFSTDQLQDITLHTTASTTYVDVPGSSLAPFTLTRSTNFMFSLIIIGTNDTALNYLDVTMNDSVDGDLLNALCSYDGGTAKQSTSVFLGKLSPGTHTLKLKYQAGPGGTAYLSSYLYNYVKLGD